MAYCFHACDGVEPEPLVYTVAQAATVLQVSPDTVTRLVRPGVLDRVPHIDGTQLIPRASIDRLVQISDRSENSHNLGSVRASDG